ncbi:hypothetical protein lerEdw1_001217, partial [Lerista edwardsae]
RRTHPELAESRTPCSVRMTHLAFIFLVAFLAITTAQEKPEVCGCLGASCTSETVTCAADQDTCISVEDQFTLQADKLSITGHFKGCAKNDESIDGSFAFDFGRGVQVNISSKLCKTQDCQAGVNEPFIRFMENGKECPLCYKSGQSSCSANGTLLCRGDMLNCTTARGVIIEGNTKIPFAAQGCGTPSVCEITKTKSPVLFPSGLFTIQLDKVTCNSASGLAGFRLSLLVAFLSPCLVGLLSVKAFFA